MRVACATLLMAGAMAAALPLSAVPGNRGPFHASFDVVFQSFIVQPPPNIRIRVNVQGQGHATHMGRSETFTNNQVVDQFGAGIATYTVIGANGDTLVFEDTVQGSGSVTGSAQFTSETDGVGEFTFDGTISSPGKK